MGVLFSLKVCEDVLLGCRTVSLVRAGCLFGGPFWLSVVVCAHQRTMLPRILRHMRISVRRMPEAG